MVKVVIIVIIGSCAIPLMLEDICLAHRVGKKEGLDSNRDLISRPVGGGVNPRNFGVERRIWRERLRVAGGDGDCGCR